MWKLKSKCRDYKHMHVDVSVFLLRYLESRKVLTNSRCCPIQREAYARSKHRDT
jgi:hypothetical protein